MTSLGKKRKILLIDLTSKEKRNMALRLIIKGRYFGLTLEVWIVKKEEKQLVLLHIFRTFSTCGLCYLWFKLI